MLPPDTKMHARPTFAKDGDMLPPRVGRDGQDATGVKGIVCLTDGERMHVND
jgi:hypothetical protein